MPANGYEVRCIVNHTETVLGRHRTARTCRRRFLHMSRLLLEMLRNIPYKVRVWEQDPHGKVLDQVVQDSADAGSNQGLPQGNPAGTTNKELGKAWTELFDALGQLGVTDVVMEYRNSGYDEHAGLTVTNEHGHQVELDTELADRIEDLCDAEIVAPRGEYVEGSVTLHIEKRQVLLDHHAYHTQVDHQSDQWGVPETEDTEDE